MHVYVDGSGPPDPKFGYFVEETNQSSVTKMGGITNNEAEYLAIIQVLNNVTVPAGEELIIYSDSQLVVNQIRHEWGINEERLRNLAAKVWDLLKGKNVKVEWIPRKNNKAGKMLGS